MWLSVKSMSQVQRITELLLGVQISKTLIVLDLDKTLIGNVVMSPRHDSPTPILQSRLCDSSTPRVLTTLSQQGASVLVLTARNRIDVGITEETVRTFLPKKVLLSNKPHETPNWYFANGICSCGLASKGDVLIELLERFGKEYECIIVVDDLEDNLHSYIKRLSESNNRFIAILYQYSPLEVNTGSICTLKLRQNKHVRILTCGGTPIDINEPLTA
jgi:hypothetical protein